MALKKYRRKTTLCRQVDTEQHVETHFSVCLPFSHKVVSLSINMCWTVLPNTSAARNPNTLHSSQPGASLFLQIITCVVFVLFRYFKPQVTQRLLSHCWVKNANILSSLHYSISINKRLVLCLPSWNHLCQYTGVCSCVRGRWEGVISY